MKKIMFALAAIAMAVSAQAASVAWQFSATAADAGNMVYLLAGTEAKTDWASADEVAAAALASGTVAKSGRAYGAAGTVTKDSIVKGDPLSLYYVVVKGDQFATTAPYNAAANVYDTSAGDSPVSGTSIASSSLSSFADFGGGGGDDPIPEPTSGLLLLVGGAMLALRRKQK